MKLLFIGGTRFVGLAMAQEALRRGHTVELFHRGRTPSDALPGARHRIGDRHGDLSALDDDARADADMATDADADKAAAAGWDAVIDVCGFRPHEIDTVAAALRGRFGRYVFVSSISVYDAAIPAGSDEQAPLAAPELLDGGDPRMVAIDGRTYGALKVMCEQAVRRHDPQALVLRPSYVFGPHDPTGRFPTWVQRLAAPGPGSGKDGVVEVPGPADTPMQWIDARDLAAFALDAIEAGVSGTYHLAGPAVSAGAAGAAGATGACTWGQMMQTVCDAVSPAGTTLRWLDVDTARARAQAAADAAAQADTDGTVKAPPLYPLWAGGESSGLLAVDTAAAQARGLRCRPLAETSRDVLAWLRR